MRGATNFDQRPGKLGFWLVFTGMLGLGFAFAIGGTIQVFVYRTLGLDWFGGDVSPAMLFTKAMVPLFGLVFAAGVCLIVYDLITLGLRQPSAAIVAAEAPAPSGWGRQLTGWETGIWLLGMWIFGAIITLGLLSFNLNTVQEGNALIPYVMGGIGYPGLLLVTLFFVWRFLSSLEARNKVNLGPIIAQSPLPAGTA
jgi:nitric oxide reductase subunit B